MRYLDISSINVPTNWIDLARVQFGASNRSLWAYFKRDFESIVGKKCWFSESLNNGADNDIEHFRPKGLHVKELKKENAHLEPDIWGKINANTRTGYDFLALEFSNYRYACTFVNSPRSSSNKKVRGKSNFFPLKIDSPIASQLTQLSNEIICFLDPCNEKDPEYLTFNNLGQIEPSKSVLNTSWEYCRVMVTIEVLHLHYSSFIEARLELWGSCEKLIELANALYLKQNKSNEEEICLAHYIKDLTKHIQKKAQYSAVAIDCIRFYKRKYPWLETYFTDEKLKK